MALLPGKRAKLHNAIEKRFHRMLDAGFLDEVKKLIDQYHLDLTYPAMRSVGYRQAWHYWHDQLSYDQFVHKAIVASRQLAKRQLTWIRNWPFEIKTYDPFANNRIADQIIANIQSHLNQKNS
jgi:tRNA dimethylallyltransferase